MGPWDSAEGKTAWHLFFPVFMDREKDLTEAFESLLHKDFPNSERVGCPGRDALTNLFASPQNPALSAILDHVRQCGPCFDELKKLHALKK